LNVFIILFLGPALYAKKMAANQSARQQKRSRLSDAASEKPVRSDEERSKRRRVSGANESQSQQTVEPTDGVKAVSNDHVQTQGVETKQKGPAPWSFSRPVGGRYNNLDPILTDDEA
jgi:NET1-associated nuclear protein 1 (U3 small nucleolar RNA-associated protein 17)